MKPIAGADKKEGGFSGRVGRINTLPCNELEEVKTLFLEKHGIGGTAPRDCRILKVINKLNF